MTMDSAQFDVAVLGAGPGGYVAAIRAAQLGLKVALIEREHLGGVCLNWGCIPTKTLLHNAEVVDLIKEGEEYGISYDNLRVDYAKAYKRSREVSNRLVRGIEFLMKKNDVRVFIGEGTLTGPHSILVEHRSEERQINAEYLIVATGAQPLVLPFLSPDGTRVFTYRQLLEVQRAPKSMVVIGSGAIGMEFAYIFHAYGADVTILEALPRIMPLEDEEVSAEITRSFNRRGIKTIAGAKVVETPAATSKWTIRWPPTCRASMRSATSPANCAWLTWPRPKVWWLPRPSLPGWADTTATSRAWTTRQCPAAPTPSPKWPAWGFQRPRPRSAAIK
jgi:dihydrolipoamide dehydrogenase